ncbi:MAG: hypothetical protein HeimAB125_07680 [Candidatus Heimdallarchaeota archaeon AB_125]|nr:MAG: hypothetical protein HeimAB125_07680 [Candidatus Heimdallarchaeota archaeon AB_125]
MGLRVFSVRRDGSYNEVPAKRESFYEDNGAYLIVDRVEKRIYIYRKDGIPSSLAYWAGRAATNLKIRKGSKYQIINIELEERDRILPNLIRKLEEIASEEASISTKPDLGGKAYVYGEKTVPALQGLKQITIETKTKQKAHQIAQYLKSYDSDETVKILASKILSDSDIELLKNVEKPLRTKLRRELIDKIDNLLEIIY